MHVQIENVNDIAVINVTGRIDAVTASEFENEVKLIIDQGAGKLLLNLQELEYISSAGLRSILTLLKLSKSSNIKLAFSNLQDMVSEVFKVSGFTGMLSIYASKDEAIIGLSS